MRTMSEAQLSALSGSSRAAGVYVHAWYDGVIASEFLPVETWSVGWDSARQVQAQLSLTVRDVDGTLAPWSIADPLGVGGARLQVIYHFGSDVVDPLDLGWFRITGADPVESWRVIRLQDSTNTGTSEAAFFGERLEWVSGGASIPVQADDLTKQAAIDKLLAPESPAGLTPTVLGEVRRLLNGIMPVFVAPGVTDKAVSTSLVYERERMDAVEDLLATAGCWHRMTGDGQLEVYPTARTAPVWVVAGGDDGVLISVQRSQKLDGLYNGAVSEGGENGLPLIGRAFETAGPLRWEGPHGRYPTFHSATGLLKSQAAVDLDAKSRLRTDIAQRSVVLTVTCLPHPGLQIGDWVQVANPTTSGDAVPLVGVVRSLTLRGSASQGVSLMSLTVECSYDDVQAVRWAVQRAS